jgi:hypothetical protein
LCHIFAFKVLGLWVLSWITCQNYITFLTLRNLTRLILHHNAYIELKWWAWHKVMMFIFCDAYLDRLV